MRKSRLPKEELLFRSCKLGLFDFLMTQLSAPRSLRIDRTNFVKKGFIIWLSKKKFLAGHGG